MDNNPSDHLELEVPTSMIKLKSSDGEIFEVQVKVAKLSLLFKEMLDDLGVEENEVISIPPNAPKISGALLKKIIEWVNHHQNDPPAAEGEEKVNPTDDISTWDANFLRVGPKTLLKIIRAANYLNIQGLLDVSCKKLANVIKGKNVAQVRHGFNIPNDFSPVEKKQVREESEWCKGFEVTGGYRMDQTIADSIQNTGHEDDHVVEECFRNSIVARKVLKHISSSELLCEFQFVNKVWNYEARSLMKKRGDVLARLTCRHSQEELEAFLVHLQQMNVVPFSGISVTIFSLFCDHRHTVQSSALDSTREAIMDRLPLKCLSLSICEDWGTNWWDCKDCPKLQWVKKLLQDFSGFLEKLKLDIVNKREEFIQHFVQDCSFPGLRVVKLQDGAHANTRDMAYTRYIKALVSRAENLQELHTRGPINLMHNVLQGRKAVLVHTYVVHAPFERVSESVIDVLRLSRLSLTYVTPQFRFERFNRITHMLLQASCTTLCAIAIDPVFAVPLMCYGICLENVKRLKMWINYDNLERVQPQILRIVKNFGFNRIFPNVHKVEIIHAGHDSEISADHLTAIIEQADAVLRDPVPDRAVNVKELELELRGNLSDAAALFYAEILPSIQKLTVKAAASEGGIPFELIWKNWMDVEELEVHGTITGNLDSVFCGIFPDEVLELRKKDEEYLKAVNIVPVMPAITSLKNLKTLVLNYNGCTRVPFVDDGTFMFSKVTALIVFARLPAVAVSLDILSYEVPPAMTYLKPYVSVSYELLIYEELPEDPDQFI